MAGMNPITFANLVAFIERHALANYDAGGWDVVVECYDVADIADVLDRAGATTEAEALAAFAPLVDVWADRQADERNRER